MPVDAAVRDYLLLAFRLDYRRPGLLSVCSGDLGLREQARGEPPPSAGSLVRAAGELALRLPGLGLAPQRERFLSAQLLAMEWSARRLAGQAVPFRTEIATSYDTVPEPGSPDEYRAAHRDLDALLPGRGDLAARLAAHRRRDEVPPARLVVAVEALSVALRGRARAAGLLSGAEGVVFETVADAAWSALHQRQAAGRSRILLNLAVPVRRAALARLVAHEAYPGHHTEQWRREALLVGQRGWGEHAVVVLGTPQSLLAEGAAELGLHVLVGPGWGRWAAEVLDTVGLGFDGELAERVERCTARLARVRQDAALMLDDRGAADDVLAHLRRWLLLDEGRARRVLRFLADPRWRGHTVAYVEGAALVRRWLDRPGATVVQRWCALHDEPWTPSGLRAELRRPV
ncbi:MAG: DUF885 domain-containing protein [Pseudonocardia sp.]|nr:DUF885 domain-containing protein [Pseudonocardia sp.]